MEFYGIIDENVDRLGRLIDDLLNVSRIEKMGAAGIEMNWAHVELHKVVDSVVNTQRGRTDKHTLVVDFVPEEIIIETDPDKIQNILHNYINNAIKYSPQGGEVRIMARVESPTEQFPTGSLLLGVRDQGLGIPEAYLKKLGEKFVRIKDQAHQSAGGTGIGLYLVKNLVERHGGYIWPESEGPGKGSTFFLRIPLRQPPRVPDCND
jgi:two-component system phosphate regulon sensor histidine kinase PhoR